MENKMEKSHSARHLFPQTLGKLALLIALGISGSGHLALLNAAETEVPTVYPEATSSSEATSEESRPSAESAGEMPMAGRDVMIEELDQDPWEPFNEKMFSLNRNLDRYVLKNVARGYDTVLPDAVQIGIKNALDNLDVVRRLVNNLLQLKLGGATREVTRFTINSTIGIAGLFDVAKDGLGIEQSDEDTGQTFGVYGAGPGPYLVLPLLPVMTVRDGFGYLADGAMNPLNYFIPIGATVGIAATDTVNERSLHLDEFQQVEESVIDLYGAVRNAYLQRRAKAILE
jgi:phospholipid-binding lipoprotein MlaA